MAAFSTIEALENLVTSIPTWSTRLDELNSQIAQRQRELAHLTDTQPSVAISVRNKGSTESLRPQDGAGLADTDRAYEAEPRHAEVIAEVDSDKPDDEDATPESPMAPESPANKADLPAPKQTLPQIKSRVLRRRKTASMDSRASQTPKYRTRSMIIVYYDSAVQEAFEELVRFVSSSRNTMRKGKMAMRMEEMRRVAELETEEEEAEDERKNESVDRDNLMAKLGQSYLRTRSMGIADDTSSPVKTSEPTPDRPLIDTSDPALQSALEIDDEPEELDEIPAKLEFVTARNRVVLPAKPDSTVIPTSISMMRGSRRDNKNRATLDIFDELDKSLEWCQSQCEHAAHQFLRDGDCSREIRKIKQRFSEVVERAQKEVDETKHVAIVKSVASSKIQTAAQPASTSTSTSASISPPATSSGQDSPPSITAAQAGRGRSLRSIEVRRRLNTPTKSETSVSRAEATTAAAPVSAPSSTPPATLLNATDMLEVDDEEDGDSDDVNFPTPLVYKRARDL